MATRKAAAMKAANTIAPFDDAKWRAREDMHTLSRAREIEADRRRMAAATREAAAEVKKLQSVARKHK